MVSRRNLDKSMATEKVDILFYNIIENKGKRMLKPLTINTRVSLMVIRAILDDTVIPSFYSTLAKNLIERGVKSGSKVQLRAKFSPSHAMVDPALKGTKILCEVNI